MEKMDMNYEYPYEEELKLSADRDMFDNCCISCCADDAFYDIDLIPEEKEEEKEEKGKKQMIMSIIIPAFVVFLLGTIEPGKDGKPVPLRKKVEVWAVLLLVALLGVAYVYLRLFSEGLL